jgi:hypothetical protein
VITGVRDGLLLLSLALLLCLVLVGTIALADAYHISRIWAAFALNSFGMIPLFLRAFRGHLNRPSMTPFLGVLAAIHGSVFVGVLKWRIPVLYWFPIFGVELSLGAWAAYRFYGVIPRGDI